MKDLFKIFIDFAVKWTFSIILTTQVPRRKITIPRSAVLDDEENKIIKELSKEEAEMLYRTLYKLLHTLHDEG